MQMNRKTRRAVKSINRKKSPKMDDTVLALRAQIEEMKAENEYLRSRNLQLRVAVEKLSIQIAEKEPDSETEQG